MDTAQLGRLSRKDLQRMQAGTAGRNNGFGLDRNVGNEEGGNENSVEGGYKKHESEDVVVDDGEEENDFDNDFSIHDLKNLAITSSSLVKDDELMSNTSSSAASTVIHNPHLKSEDDTQHLQEHVLDTLESDPDLHNKLHRTLKLSNANLNLQAASRNNESNENTVDDNTLDDGNDTINGIIDELNNFDEKDETNNLPHHYTVNDVEPHVEEENSSTDSLNVVENLTDDKLLDFIDGMLPSPPSSPPRELDPSKLYALYDFTGPDPSHLPLLKNDSVHLLNDSDSYWWLVKRDDNNRIGFAPAEILETYTERLARLNCWKNEVLERGGIKGLRHEEERKLFKSEHPPSLTNLLSQKDSAVSLQNNLERKGSLKKPKSSGDDLFGENKKTVSFADLNEIQEHSVLSESESIEENSIGLNNSSLSLLDNYDNKDDEINELHKVTSDDESQSRTQLVVPKKKRRNFLIKNLDTYVDPEERSSTSPVSSANDDVNSLISTPTKGQDHNVTVSTCGSADSVDQMTNLQSINVKKIRKYPDNNKTVFSPMPPKRKDSEDVQEHRLASLQMLDDLLDMYPEFATIGDGSTSPSPGNSPRKQKLGEGYRSNRENLKEKLLDAKVTSPLLVPTTADVKNSNVLDVANTNLEESLHPSTQRIFTPLFSHMEKLDQMVSDLQHL